MTVSSQINKIIYIGNGVAKEFAIPFSFLEQKHIKVEQKLENVQAERTDWSVKDGNLVFENAPESGAEIAIVREVPLTQETDYRDNEILHAETLERNFDKLTMQVQQLAEKSARAVTVGIFDDTAADSLIPSIRKAVSDCADYATTAKNKAQEALTQAQTAADQAQSATAAFVAAQNCLTEKADKNLSNIKPSAEFIKTVMSWLMPHWKQSQVITALSFTAPSKGWIVGQCMGTADYKINHIYIGGCMATASWSSRGNIQVLVDEGDVFSLEKADFSQPYSITFVPCKGEATAGSVL